MISLDYLAGFIDGEGCFNAGKNLLGFKIELSNTNLNIMEEIQESFGGKLYSYNIGKRRRRVSYKLTWSGNAAVELAKLLMDKLRIKKRQAEVFSYMQFNTQGIKLTDNEREIREVAHLVVKRLNNPTLSLNNKFVGEIS